MLHGMVGEEVGRKRKVNRSAGMKRACSHDAGKHNISTLCLTFHQHAQALFSQALVALTVMLDPTSSITKPSMSEYTCNEREPRTPSRPCVDGRPPANMQCSLVQEAPREGQLGILRVDTCVAEPQQPATRRVSPSETTSESPASSTSNHSRQDSTASYTPLRSARGSLSLGVS